MTNTMIKKYAIIVAGGSGKRMQSELPKQFIQLAGKPILMHTIETFHNFDSQIEIIVVLPEDQFGYWNSICTELNFSIQHRLTIGGTERFYSVKNGLQHIENNSLVAIHDGVRPFVNHATIERCFNRAEECGNAIPVVEVHESVREIQANTNRAVDRNNFKLVQTPQVFKSEQIIKAYSAPFSPLFTDDASVLENQNHTINLVEGNRENIKITTPYDLIYAEALLKRIAQT